MTSHTCMQNILGSDARLHLKPFVKAIRTVFPPMRKLVCELTAIQIAQPCHRGKLARQQVSRNSIANALVAANGWWQVVPPG